MIMLYVVPTPIGNLSDITLRAIEVLKDADLVLVEDTRTSSVLFSHYGIKTPMQSYHQYNEHKTVDAIVEKIKQGNVIAIITDAGTPGISDPGFLLVRECINNGIEVNTLPGASAFILALVNSGFPTDKFYFEGFLPHKKGRNTRLNFLKELNCTFVLYESPYRVLKTLEQLCEVIGEDRPASVSRELTKKFEETRRGTLKELKSYFTENKPKGEFVIVVKGV
ncbi:MAG: 16S rRNA (cytidine(1402)-2'-O)-methyltransferase [Bacteroidales bacterium]